MAGADDDSAAWAAQFAEVLASHAATALALFDLIPAEWGDAQAGDAVAGDAVAGEDRAWVRSAERLEALWRDYMQDRTEAFVAAWPEFLRNLDSLLPLFNRGQPLFAMLAQFLPLLVGPELLRRASETGGEGLVKGLERFLAELCNGQMTQALPDDPASEPSGLDRTLP